MKESICIANEPEFVFNGNRNVTLTHKWYIRWYVDGRRCTFTIEKDFTSDGASIPRIFWSIIGSPFIGSYRKSAIFHDALYSSKIVSRKVADKLFNLAMKSEGGFFAKRLLIYWSVRLFGMIAWEKKNTTLPYVSLRKRIIN